MSNRRVFSLVVAMAALALCLVLLRERTQPQRSRFHVLRVSTLAPSIGANSLWTADGMSWVWSAGEKESLAQNKLSNEELERALSEFVNREFSSAGLDICSVKHETGVVIARQCLDHVVSDGFIVAYHNGYAIKKCVTRLYTIKEIVPWDKELVGISMAKAEGVVGTFEYKWFPTNEQESLDTSLRMPCIVTESGLSIDLRTGIARHE